MKDFVLQWYNWMNYEMSDLRTAHLPLLTSPFLVLLILVFYNYFVLKLGPKLMENVKPFDLKMVIVIYDALQVMSNSYLFYKAFQLGWSGYYNYFYCNDLDPADTPFNREVGLICYFYFLSKGADLIDTIFFVLRKKNSHLSFLHLYHHTGMVLATFINVKYFPEGHHTFLGLINSMVHCFMYTYYMISTLNPSQKTLRWKKFITQLQMTQFLLIAIHTLCAYLKPSCNYPHIIALFLVSQNTFMFLLFWDFYRKAYGTKSTPQKKQA